MCDKIVPDQWIFYQGYKAITNRDRANVLAAARTRQKWIPFFIGDEMIIFKSNGSIAKYKKNKVYKNL